MIHDVSCCSWGKLHELEEYVEQNKILREKMIEYICSRTKFPRKKLVDIIDKKQDFYFNAEDALKWKFIDEIIDINTDDAEPKKVSKKKSNKNIEIEDGNE